jgi:hypothetical protein
MVCTGEERWKGVVRVDFEWENCPAFRYGAIYFRLGVGAVVGR